MKRVGTILSFIIEVIKDSLKNELYFMGNELTYKLFISLFPLLIFIFSFINYLDIDTDILMSLLIDGVPDQVLAVIIMTIDTINAQENSKELLTISLFVTILSASSGFIAVIRGVNRTFDTPNKRSFLKNRLISVILVILFTFSLFVTQLLIVFGDSILKLISTYNLYDVNFENVYKSFSYKVFKYSTSITVILSIISITYKLSLGKYICFKDVLPGAIFTTASWVLASMIYNIYIVKYTAYTSVYGSIGSVFILVFWINLIAIIMLIGSQINATIYNRKKRKI